MSQPGPPEDSAAEQEAERRRRRVKVVLAERRGARKVVRTMVHIEQQTQIGEQVVRVLIRKQLVVAVTLAVITAVVLGSLPLLFALFPKVAGATLFGVRLPWLLLGAAAYPLLIGVGALYNRVVERNEKDFIDMVEN
ncbi:hypothetical protein N8J89_00520 [Crossiella sp. CA-258035]|uniref:hypothetical protein n=1 Tax=Crossiella sp. CA-258035 TaxID=2981138 RepID=UPI0024BC75C7|nr:hypothetical protein [Crossiella sp. CA-258035]WHT19615.1 hypothetical protein N8J89_00520 [Crossiella sp. CA-258035]